MGLNVHPIWETVQQPVNQNNNLKERWHGNERQKLGGERVSAPTVQGNNENQSTVTYGCVAGVKRPGRRQRNGRVQLGKSNRTITAATGVAGINAQNPTQVRMPQAGNWGVNGGVLECSMEQ